MKKKLVNPKGNQHWLFTGRSDAEVEAPIFWPPDAKSQLIGKDPDAGKDGGHEEKGATEGKMAGWHHQLNAHEFEQTLRDNEDRKPSVLGSQRVRHNWVNEQQQMKKKKKKNGFLQSKVRESCVSNFVTVLSAVSESIFIYILKDLECVFRICLRDTDGWKWDECE